MNSHSYYHKQNFLQRRLAIKLKKLDALLPMDMHITTISKMTQTPNI